MPPNRRKVERKCEVTGQMVDFETEIEPPYELIRQYEEIVKKQKDKKDKGNPPEWHAPPPTGQALIPPPQGQPPQ